MTPYAQSLLDSIFGSGCNGERALDEVGTRGDYALICGCCGENSFEWGFRGFTVGRCRNCGTLHFNDDNNWRVAV